MLHSALSWNSQYDTSLFTIPWRLEGKVQAECQNYFIYFYLSVKCKNIYISNQVSQKYVPYHSKTYSVQYTFLKNCTSSYFCIRLQYKIKEKHIDVIGVPTELSYFTNIPKQLTVHKISTQKESNKLTNFLTSEISAIRRSNILTTMAISMKDTK